MAVRHPTAVEVPTAAPTAEVQTIVIDATGGTWTLTIDGQTTTALAFDISTANLENAIDALSNMEDGDVEVTGSPGSYTLTWLASHGNAPAPTTNAASLTGGASTATVETTTPGTGGDVVSSESGLLYGWSIRETAGSVARLGIYDSADPHGTPIAFVSLAANGAETVSLATPLQFVSGLYVARIAGTAGGSLWIVE